MNNQIPNQREILYQCDKCRGQNIQGITAEELGMLSSSIGFEEVGRMSQLSPGKPVQCNDLSLVHIEKLSLRTSEETVLRTCMGHPLLEHPTPEFHLSCHMFYYKEV